MQKDRLRSHYSGTFNRDKSDDLKIDDILRQTLSRPFQSDTWNRMQEELQDVVNMNPVNSAQVLSPLPKVRDQ